MALPAARWIRLALRGPIMRGHLVPLPQQNHERTYCSGIIQAPHACDPGSTPGVRIHDFLAATVLIIRPWLLSEATNLVLHSDLDLRGTWRVAQHGSRAQRGTKKSRGQGAAARIYLERIELAIFSV